IMQAAELVPEVGGSSTTPTSLGTAPSTADAEPPRNPSSEATSSAKTWVLIGEAAAAAAGIGIGIGYLAAAGAAQTRADDANRHIEALTMKMGGGCAGSPTFPPERAGGGATLGAAVNDHRRDTTFAIAGFVGAGLGATALTATLIF